MRDAREVKSSRPSIQEVHRQRGRARTHAHKRGSSVIDGDSGGNGPNSQASRVISSHRSEEPGSHSMSGLKVMFQSRPRSGRSVGNKHTTIAAARSEHSHSFASSIINCTPLSPSYAPLLRSSLKSIFVCLPPSALTAPVCSVSPVFSCVGPGTVGFFCLFFFSF